MDAVGKEALSAALYQILLAIQRKDIEHARELVVDAIYIVDAKRALQIEKGAP